MCKSIISTSMVSSFLMSLLCLFFFPNSVNGQNVYDTIYYDREWNVCKYKFNASYYRVIQKPEYADSLGRLFTDYYYFGEKQGSGYIISLGTESDSATVFNSKLCFFRKNGQIQAEMSYKKGVPDGSFVNYSIDGLVVKSISYRDGKVDGVIKSQAYDGSFFHSSATKGLPDSTYYNLSDENGHSVRIDYLGNGIDVNSPEKSGRKTFYRNNRSYQYYLTEGVSYAVTVSAVKQYGKWYMVEINISNDSPYEIEFDASKVSAIEVKPSYIQGEFDTNYLNAWRADQYMKRVKNRQNWGEALYAFSTGLAAGSAGYTYTSTSSVSFNPNYGTTYTYSNSTTYNPGEQMRASQEASRNVSILEQENWESRKHIQANYIGRHTIFPGEILSGYVLIKRTKSQFLTVRIEHKGVGLLYDWNVMK